MIKKRTEKFGSLLYDGDRRKLYLLCKGSLPDFSRGEFKSYEVLHRGLIAPICVTWEITYNCNLHCLHCLSSPTESVNELSLSESKQLIDKLSEMQVFYVNIGGGEPLTHPDFFIIIKYLIKRGIGVKLSTNGILIDDSYAKWLARLGYIDVQISVDGATPEVNDSIRGEGSFERAIRAANLLNKYGVKFGFNTVVTRANFHQLDALYELAKSHGGYLRLSRFRPSGRGKEKWGSLHLSKEQNISLYYWLNKHPDTLTGDSFFHLSALSTKLPKLNKLPGLNMCGAARVTCCITPAGDVYPCSFLVAEPFYAGNIRELPFSKIWSESPSFLKMREEYIDSCRNCQAFDVCYGGCIAVKYFTDIDLHEPDPECPIAKDG